MTDYRLYCLDGVRKITSGEWIEATGDAEAIMIVQARKLPLACELWNDGHLVATFPEGPVEPVCAGSPIA